MGESNPALRFGTFLRNLNIFLIHLKNTSKDMDDVVVQIAITCVTLTESEV